MCKGGLLGRYTEIDQTLETGMPPTSDPNEAETGWTMIQETG